MEIPRLAANITANNLWLVGVGFAAVLFSLIVTVLVFTGTVRWLARTTGVKSAEAGAERLLRPFKAVASLLAVLSMLASAAVVGISVWYELDLHAWVLRVGQHVTWGMVWMVSSRILAVSVVIAGFLYLRRLIRPLLPKLEKRLAESPVFSEQSCDIGGLIVHVERLVSLALGYGALRVGSELLELPGVLLWAVRILVYVLLVVQTTLVVAAAVGLLIANVDRLTSARMSGTRLESYYAGMRGLWPLARRSVEAVIYISGATLIVAAFVPLEPIAPYGPTIISLIALFFLTRVVIEVSAVGVREAMTGKEDVADETAKRRVTLVYMVQSAASSVIYFCAALFGLNLIGVDPAPFLAGAGIVGLTIGLGAQKLVSDIVAGFFMLFEGQVLIGDYVRIGDAEGRVESAFLRVTQIRDRLGRLHTIRNGDILTVINYSRGWTLAVVEVCVAYEADLKRALEVMEGVCRELKEVFAERILETPQIMGIEAFDESWLRVRVEIRVPPGEHFDIKRAFLRLLFDAFTDNGIEIPYPRVIQLDQLPAPGRS